MMLPYQPLRTGAQLRGSREGVHQIVLFFGTVLVAIEPVLHLSTHIFDYPDQLGYFAAQRINSIRVGSRSLRFVARPDSIQ